MSGIHSILILEDDITFSLMLATWLGKKGFQVDTIASVKEAKQRMEANTYDLLLSDLRLPDGDGIELLKWMNEKELSTPLIMMTSYAEIQTAVLAIKLGAFDYIAKPLHPEDLLEKMQEALKAPNTSTQPKEPDSPDKQTASLDGTYVLGKSPAAIQLYEHARLVAPTDISVLITGSSGTGKEHIARYIHENSNRRNAPFIAVDCGAIPKDLAASEFFGHIKGSFTGAIENKTGAFVAAQGGTIFLDEIGNLTYEIQIQLLRALQERKIKPIGTNQEITIDVRLLSATNENLRSAIDRGEFREDLYHRLNEFTIRIPDLKERKEDFMLFAALFLKQSNKELHKNILGFDPEASRLLESFSWPGNIRQLKNVIRYATLLATSPYITTKELPVEITESVSSPPISSSATLLRNEEHEREQILKALKEAGNNKSKAAQLLGIDRKTLYNKLKLYQLD
ncbi:two-component system response regulator HydG [Parabacteroides sp. PM5-20]|nr:two-component system response regulator HydG [Parabacteroides sp. PM5-20]